MALTLASHRNKLLFYMEYLSVASRYFEQRLELCAPLPGHWSDITALALVRQSTKDMEHQNSTV